MSKSGSNATRCLNVTKVSPISLAFVPSTTHLSPPFCFLRFDNATEQALSEGWGRFKSQINHLFLLPRPTRNPPLQRHYAHRSKRVHCNRLDLMLWQVLSETVPAHKPPKSVAKKAKKTKAPPPQMEDTAFHVDELSKFKTGKEPPDIDIYLPTTAVQPPKPKPSVEHCSSRRIKYHDGRSARR